MRRPAPRRSTHFLRPSFWDAGSDWLPFRGSCVRTKDGSSWIAWSGRDRTSESTFRRSSLRRLCSGGAGLDPLQPCVEALSSDAGDLEDLDFRMNALGVLAGFRDIKRDV